MPVETEAVVYHQFGSVDNVLKKEKLPLPASLGSKQVLVKMIAAPINPADINTIEGTYGESPSTFPAVGGNEGVGKVVDIGSGVSLTRDQLVVPGKPGLGTWREYMVVDESDLIPVSNSIPVEYAATLLVNPCTAYRLLNDFVDLKEGDVIVQNGASSMVGTAVIQMARQRGIRTINIVRDRPDSKDTIDRLKQLGGDIVVTDEYANTKEMMRLVADLPKAKLALNCVGGDVSRKTVNFLGKNGVMVTYGGLSRKPVTIPTSSLIFNDIAIKGFWMTRWVKEHSREERINMVEEISDMIQQRKLILFMETHKFSKFNDALQVVTGPSQRTKRKVVLKFE